MMLGNNTFSHVAHFYGIDRLVDLHNLKAETARAQSQTIAADAFEAYIGAVYRCHQSRGALPNLDRWFQTFFSHDVFPAAAGLAATCNNIIAQKVYKHCVGTNKAQISRKRTRTVRRDSSPVKLTFAKDFT